MLDHPVWHALETDPRKDVQNMYKSKNMKLFTVDKQKDVLESGQAHVATTEVYELKIKKEVELGLTYLGRMQDSGIVCKILSKYYMSNCKPSILKNITFLMNSKIFDVLSS